MWVPLYLKLVHIFGVPWSYKMVGKPHNAADARHVDFPKFWARGAPMMVDIGDVRQGMSELLQAVYTNP